MSEPAGAPLGAGRRPGLVARALAGAVRGYQLVVSPWFAPTCRYYPSCSAYGLEALRTHGAVRGLALTGWRILRCNPWSRGGVDHVPPPGHWRDADRDTQLRGVPADEPEPADHLHEGAPNHAHGPAGRTLGSRTSRQGRS